MFFRNSNLVNFGFHVGKFSAVAVIGADVLSLIFKNILAFNDGQ